MVPQVLIFYPVVTLLPVLAGAYLYWSGRLIGSGSAARFFGPLSIQFGGLFLVNWMLPNIRVRWHAALAGTLITGFALEGLKWGFVHFAKRGPALQLQRRVRPAGAGAAHSLVDLHFVVVVLGGAEIANTIQNLRLLEAEERRHRDDEPINGLVAAQNPGFRGGGLPTGRQGHRSRPSRPRIRPVGGGHRSHGSSAEGPGSLGGSAGRQGRLIPGRAAGTISLQDVLAAFRSTDLEAATGTTSPALGRADSRTWKKPA